MASDTKTSFSVKGRTAIVTGAGSDRGINCEFAKALLERGCDVILADISLRAEATELLTKYKKSPKAIYVETDVTDWGQLGRLFDIANSEFGGADIVTPGAGVFEPPESNFWQAPGADGSASVDPVSGLGHYLTFDVNITHPVRMTQLAIAHFLSPGGGKAPASPSNPKRVVAIASIASELALLPIPLYCASKWAVSGFVRSLEALEPQLGIRVNAVAPGIVKTPIWTDHAEKLKFFDEASDIWISPRDVALEMIKMVEDSGRKGGLVLEIGHGHTRAIPTLENSGPSGAGHSVSKVADGYIDVFRSLEVTNWGIPTRGT